jgi:hypothetical protein
MMLGGVTVDDEFVRRNHRGRTRWALTGVCIRGGSIRRTTCWALGRRWLPFAVAEVDVLFMGVGLGDELTR